MFFMNKKYIKPGQKRYVDYLVEAGLYNDYAKDFWYHVGDTQWMAKGSLTQRIRVPY